MTNYNISLTSRRSWWYVWSTWPEQWEHDTRRTYRDSWVQSWEKVTAILLILKPWDLNLGLFIQWASTLPHSYVLSPFYILYVPHIESYLMLPMLVLGLFCNPTALFKWHSLVLLRPFWSEVGTLLFRSFMEKCPWFLPTMQTWSNQQWVTRLWPGVRGQRLQCASPITQ